MAAQYDLVLKGARLYDPAAGIDRAGELAVAGGRIAAVAETIDATGAAEVRRLDGLLLMPGLIDFHVHAFPWGTDLGVEPDRHMLPRGVTSVVDAGSAGAHTFAAFRKLVIDPSLTRVRCFLHVSSIGQVHVRTGELLDAAHLNDEATVQVLEENRDVILGLKLRLNRAACGERGLDYLEGALGLAERLQVPLMVHIGDSAPTLPQILERLRPGDIVTHILTPQGNGILDERGAVIAEVHAAAERGVRYDVGEGRPNLGYGEARAALAQGLRLDSFSSDVTSYSMRGEVRDLPRTISRFLALGYLLEEVIAGVTARPAAMMGLAGEIGTIAVGALADLAAFSLEQGEYQFPKLGDTVTGKQYLTPRAVWRGGAEIAVEEL